MDNQEYKTSDYAKLFFLMIIPIYGFCFTALLAFSKDITGELKCLARGAFIVRVVFLIIVGIAMVIFFTTLLPYINNFIDNISSLRIFQ